MNPSRRPLLVGNWKMFHGDRSGAALAAECATIARALTGVEVVVAPPFTAVVSCVAECRDGFMAVAAQNLYVDAAGACTGEISARTLRDCGCSWVILGHSERRHFFEESDQLVASKVDAALGVGLNPIVCVGDTRAERDAGHTLLVVRRQIDAVASLLMSAKVPVVIAYEPVWAIGTGRSDRPADVEEVHQAIRACLRERHGRLADDTRILYGGSVNPEDAAAIFACPNVDGALVGGGSLDSRTFAAIARTAVR